MIRYEYQTLALVKDAGGSVDEALNAAGKQGWYMVHASQDARVFHAVMVRQLPRNALDDVLEG